MRAAAARQCRRRRLGGQAPRSFFAGRAEHFRQGDFTTIVAFDAGRAWKGVDTNAVTLTTGGQGNTCRFYFEEGKEYIVYASIDNNGMLGTSSCSRTKPVQDASEDLSVLGEGCVPVRVEVEGIMTPEPPSIQQEAAVQRLVIAVETIATAGAAFFVVVFTARKRRKKGRWGGLASS